MSRSSKSTDWARGIIWIAVAVAVGLGTLLASLSGLQAPVFVDGGIDIDWSPTAEASHVAQTEALAALLSMTRLLAAAAAAVCVLTVVVFTLAQSSDRIGEAATRAALGASPRRLAAWGVSRQLRGMGSALMTGATGGIALSVLARRTWPGHGTSLEAAGAGVGITTSATVLVVTLCAVALVPLVAVGRDLRGTMGSGGAVLPRYPTGLRWTLPLIQLGVTAGLLTASGLLVASALPPRQQSTAGEAMAVLTVSVEGDATAGRAAILGEALEEPGRDRAPFAAATPGAFLGLGVRDRVMAECGECYIGAMYVPIQGTRARHHAVTPDTFALMGVEVVEGREFRAADELGGPPVAVVNQALVRAVFHDGSAVGRHIRLGRGLRSWYEVVGVVDLASLGQALGGRAESPAVFVSALQHPPTSMEVFSPTTPLALSDGAGLKPVDEPGTGSLAEYLNGHAAPLRWAGRLQLGLGVLALVLSLAGVHGIMAFIISRRRPEIALRVAVGADTLTVRKFLMAEGARLILAGAVAGLWVSSVVLALASQVAGAVPEGGIQMAGAVTAMLMLAGLGAVAVVVGSLTAVAPRSVLAGASGL